MVSVFLSAFLIAGLFGIEMWPLTGWKLFSHLRHPRAVSWQAVAVDRTGVETPIPFRRLPRGYGGALHVLKGFGGLDPDERDAVCQTWSRGLETLGMPRDELRLYQVVVDRSIRIGNRRPAPSDRTLRFVCRDGTATEAKP